MKSCKVSNPTLEGTLVEELTTFINKVREEEKEKAIKQFCNYLKNETRISFNFPLCTKEFLKR